MHDYEYQNVDDLKTETERFFEEIFLYKSIVA